MSRTTDIALYLPSLRGGGAERVMVNLARGFASQGFKVDLVLARAEGPYLSEVPAAVRIVDLKARRVLSSLPGLVLYLRRERPNALLATLSHANLIALWARRLSGTSCRVVIREATTTSMSALHTHSLRGRWMPLFVRMFYPWADRVVVNSQGSAKDLARIIGKPLEQIKVIYNPVITPELFAKAEEPMTHPWFCPGEPPLILGVGRLTPAKDFPTLIRAFAIVRQKYQARLMILGEGEERANLEALIQKLGLIKDVQLAGFVENPYKYMKRATGFVLSSRWEGLPNVLIEALALGTPVVATDCPSGPREILGDGKWGKLVPVGNVKALARAIQEVIEASKRYDLRSEDLYLHLRKFSIEMVVKQYQNILGIE